MSFEESLDGSESAGSEDAAAICEAVPPPASGQRRRGGGDSGGGGDGTGCSCDAAARVVVLSEQLARARSEAAELREALVERTKALVFWSAQAKKTAAAPRQQDDGSGGGEGEGGDLLTTVLQDTHICPFLKERSCCNKI